MRERWAFLFVLVVMAGCSEKGELAVPGPSASALESAGLLGGITGLVIDDELKPVPDVEVGLRGLNITATTDEVGAFTLRDVPEGPQDIVATKLGYEAASKRVQVEAGKTLPDVRLSLTWLGNPKEAFIETFIGDSFVACGVQAANVITFIQPCGANPNHKPAFKFPVSLEKGVVSVVIESTWTPATPLTGQKLRAALWFDPVCQASRCDTAIVYGEASGESPLRVQRGNLSEPIKDNLLAKGDSTLAALALVPRTETAEAQLVLEQPVKHYVTVFYNDEPTAGYTLIPK